MAACPWEFIVLDILVMDTILWSDTPTGKTHALEHCCGTLVKIRSMHVSVRMPFVMAAATQCNVCPHPQSFFIS